MALNPKVPDLLQRLASAIETNLGYFNEVYDELPGIISNLGVQSGSFPAKSRSWSKRVARELDAFAARLAGTELVELIWEEITNTYTDAPQSGHKFLTDYYDNFVEYEAAAIKKMVVPASLRAHIIDTLVPFSALFSVTLLVMSVTSSRASAEVLRSNTKNKKGLSFVFKRFSMESAIAAKGCFMEVLELMADIETNTIKVLRRRSNYEESEKIGALFDRVRGVDSFELATFANIIMKLAGEDLKGDLRALQGIAPDIYTLGNLSEQIVAHLRPEIEKRIERGYTEGLPDWMAERLKADAMNLDFTAKLNPLIDRSILSDQSRGFIKVLKRHGELDL